MRIKKLIHTNNMRFKI